MFHLREGNMRFHSFPIGNIAALDASASSNIYFLGEMESHIPFTKMKYLYNIFPLMVFVLPGSVTLYIKDLHTTQVL